MEPTVANIGFTVFTVVAISGYENITFYFLQGLGKSGMCLHYYIQCGWKVLRVFRVWPHAGAKGRGETHH
jgi:hypothetical protein